jgi:hypothetical protein
MAMMRGVYQIAGLMSTYFAQRTNEDDPLDRIVSLWEFEIPVQLNASESASVR